MSLTKHWAKKIILATKAMRLVAECAGPSVAILMYHSVMPDPDQHVDSLNGIIHSQSSFRQQMELLAREYHPISLDELTTQLRTGGSLHRRSVVITFDDGYSDNYEVAMPILNELGVPATFYVTVDCVENRKLPWPSRLRWTLHKTSLAQWTDSRGKAWNLTDSAIREQAYSAACGECCRLSGKIQDEYVDRFERDLDAAAPSSLRSLMMTFDQVKGLLRHGHVVGSHTMSHPNIVHVTEQEAHRELGESKQRLESRLGSPIKHFSYPCPALFPPWNEKTVEQCRASGYESAVTTHSGVIRLGDNPLRLKRINPTKTASGLRWNMESVFAGRRV
jgi:peptidoglycan/xylan/chitin deacetylase (PgdA/CDA1 family)